MSHGKKHHSPRQAALLSRQAHKTVLPCLLELFAASQLEGGILQRGIETLATLVEARYGAIGILDDKGQLQQFACAGITAEEAEAIRHSPSQCTALRVSMDGDVLRLHDISREPWSTGFPPKHPCMKSLLAVAVSHQGRVYGRIYLGEKLNGQPFSDMDELLVKDYASALALVLVYHHGQSEHTQAGKILQEVAQALSGVTGEAFFRKLVANIAKTLGVDYVFIGELDPHQEQAIRTAAIFAHGKIVDNFTYGLRGTPCETVVGREFCAYPENVQQQFPDDHALVEMAVESYMGAPLFDSSGQPIGLLVALNTKPFANLGFAESVLKISAARAAAELERSRAEQALRESEERFRATFNQAAAGIAHVSPNGRFLRINQKFCDIVGYSQAEMLQHSFQEITYSDDLGADLDFVHQMLADEIRSYSMEKRYLHKNGSVVWVNLTVSLVRDASNSPKYFISVVEDITARKQAETEIFKLARVVEQTADSVVITDQNGVIQYVNPAYERVTGYSREEAIGKRPSIVKSGKHGETFYERLWQTILRGDVFRERLTNRRKDGTLYYEEKTITPLKDHLGRITHFVSTGKDITARVEAEQSLAHTTAEWSYAMDFFDDAIYLVDLDDKLVRANQAFYRLTGFVPESAIGRNITALMHPQGEPTPCRVCQARGARQDSRIIMEPQDPDNAIGRPIEVTLRVIREESGAPSGILMGIRDLTHLRKAEEALRESEASLAQAQRIAHLGNWDWNVMTDELILSDETCRILGLPFQQSTMARETFMDSVHPDDREFVIDSVGKALYEKQPYGIDHRIVLPNGMERIVHEQGEVSFDKNGKAVRMIGTIQDVTEYQQTMERLNYLANYDVLTGLPNRLLLQDRLSLAMGEVNWDRRVVAVMFLDLDRFKTINDTLGHGAGDALLKEVAGRLKACVRPGDTISRLGGDEFVIILANVAHADDVARVAQKIIDGFTPPFNIAGRELFVSTSIGITLYPSDGDDFESLLRNADTAMYHAKEIGRNTFCYYTEELNQRTAKRLALETALRHAIERNELRLHYQPQLNLKTGKIIGAEALLRWQHPEMGLISPLDFIPLAEETGLILPIGEWVLLAACRQAQAWHQQGIRNFRVAVNLSGRQFHQKSLATQVETALKESGLDSRQLHLELTESLLMHDTGETLATMEYLRALGVDFSMDDFGTGYSSLSYLKRFPIDMLKIDKSFIRDIATDPDDAAITHAIITMAHSLGIRVVAEGVETAGQLAFLRAHKCDAVQGYYLSKPVPAEEMPGLLKDLEASWRNTLMGKKNGSM